MYPRISKISLDTIDVYEVAIWEGDDYLFPILASTKESVANRYYQAALEALQGDLHVGKTNLLDERT